MIAEFQKEYRWLSNFWPAQVWCFYPLPDSETNGIKFPTVEHAYQASKCEEYEEAESFLLYDTPAQAKKAGKKVKKIWCNWEEVKVEVMKDLVRQKFTNNPELKEKLLATKNEMIQEGNYWGDIFWGVDLKTGKGQNHLGKIIMEIRQELKGIAK